MQEKILTLTHSLALNSIYKLNDFAYSDKIITTNKSGIPLIKIQDFKPSQPTARTFSELRLNLHIQSKKAELQKKIVKNSQGFSPVCKRRIEKREENLMSPLFKQPRDPGRKGLSEICDIDYLNTKKILEDKRKFEKTAVFSS